MLLVKYSDGSGSLTGVGRGVVFSGLELNREEKCDVHHLTIWQQNVWITTIGSFKQQRWRRQQHQEQQKILGFILTKQQLCTCTSHYSRHCMTAT